MATTPGFLPGESQGQRSLVGDSPWGRKESDTTEVTYAVHAKKNTEVGCRALLQVIFLTQGSNPCPLCFLHWQAGSSPLVLGSTYRYMNIYIYIHRCTHMHIIYITHAYIICIKIVL